MGKSNPKTHGADRGAERPHQSGVKSPTDWKAFSAAVIVYCITVLFLWPVSREVENAPGALLLMTVRAPQEIRVQDLEATKQKRDEINQHYPRIWTYQKDVEPRAFQRLSAAFEVLAAGKPTSGSEIQRIAEDVFQRSNVRLKNEDFDILYRHGNFPQLREALEQIVRRILESKIIVNDKGFLNANRALRQVRVLGIPEEILDRTGNEEPLDWPADVRRYLSETEVRAFFPSGEERPLAEAATKILMQLLGPNLEYDARATGLEKLGLQTELDNNPVLKSYRHGDLIADAGEQLSLTQATALSKLNEENRNAFVYRMAGLLLLIAICYFAVGIYLTRQRTLLNFTASTIVMLAIPVLLALGMGRVFIILDVDPTIRWVLFPSALVGMLSAVMIGPQVGFILVLLASFLFSVAMDESINFLIFAVFGGFTAVISLDRIRQRKDVLIAGLRVAVINVITVWLLSLFALPPIPSPTALLAAFLMGIFYAFATLPLIAMLEPVFDFVTDIRLYEITGPQNELIRMMEEKAPGTYQHVLNVTKLAESAAEAIGANFMLVRSGAYFHDIGKMLKPKYFTENQVTLDDKKAHSRISPYMSTLIIKNHVKEGIELAKKHGLPQKVIDFIPQHHGTSLIKYFYNEALQRYEETETTDIVREEDFRYAGPKPQTIEAAIVMLADSVEAIVTSVFTQSQVNENDLRRVVSQAVSDRFGDGQFDECDLTLRDLFLIRESFIKTLKARFHQRIAYPSMPKREAPREGREAGSAPVSVAAG